MWGKKIVGIIFLFLCGPVPNDPRPKIGLQPRGWGSLLYSMKNCNISKAYAKQKNSVFKIKMQAKRVKKKINWI